MEIPLGAVISLVGTHRATGTKHTVHGVIRGVGLTTIFIEFIDGPDDGYSIGLPIGMIQIDGEQFKIET